MGSNNIPASLPDLFPVSPWKNSTFNELYEIFLDDFISHNTSYLSYNVWVFPEQEDNKHTVFWHITSKDDTDTGYRLPDLLRCARLPWISPMILHCPDNNMMLNWDYEEGNGVIKTYIWLVNLDFVVILKRYNDRSRRLVTAYFLEYGNTKRKMRRKYENRI